ncbi:hypothetical protein sS8_0866 [Methylocaldum marinum]|uniref:Uncharacterized protein n=1 Tax=Methylocaldum marinum TaxID=1432792 RepID=A0A250KPC8_9GAMM|nr:hypothetical protein sS8_0866 [Methylocaldum marinum]
MSETASESFHRVKTGMRDGLAGTEELYQQKNYVFKTHEFAQCMRFSILSCMARPSIAVLSRNSPKGARWIARGDRGIGKCLLSPPAQDGDAQDQRAIRVSFLQ